MEDGRIVIPAVHPDKIRMNEAELVGLFNVVAPTLRAAKRRIYKLEILQPFTVEQRIPLKDAKNGADCYSKNGDAVTVPTWQS